MQNNKHPLKGLSPTEYYPYKGINIKVLIGGYEVFGKRYLTPGEVDLAIYNAANNIDNSIIIKK